MSETSDGPTESDEPETPPDGERSSEDPSGGDGPQEADDESDSPDEGDGPPDSDRTASGDGPQEAADEDGGDDRPETEQRPDDVSPDDGPQEADDELDDAEDRTEVDERAETDADDQADTAADDAGRAEVDDRADTEADDAEDRAEEDDTARDEGEADDADRRAEEDDAAREDAEVDDAQDDADRRAEQDDADDRADQDAAEDDRDDPPPPDDAEDPGNPPDDEGLERELRPRGRMWEGSWNSATESQPGSEQPPVQQDTAVVAEPGDDGTEPAEQQRADVERTEPTEQQRTGTEGTEPVRRQPEATTENGRDNEAAEPADGNDPPEAPNPYTGDFNLKTGELRFDRDAGNEPREPQREHDDGDVAEGPWNTDLDEYRDYAKNEDGDWEPARPETDLEREKRNEEMAEKFKGEKTVGERLAEDGQDLVEPVLKHVDVAEARAEQKHEQAHPHEESKTSQEQPRYEPADSQLPSTPEMIGSVAMTAVALGALFKQWLTGWRRGSTGPDD